jgi:hypothetical protein
MMTTNRSFGNTMMILSVKLLFDIIDTIIVIARCIRTVAAKVLRRHERLRFYSTDEEM